MKSPQFIIVCYSQNIDIIAILIPYIYISK